MASVSVAESEVCRGASHVHHAQIAEQVEVISGARVGAGCQIGLFWAGRGIAAITAPTVAGRLERFAMQGRAARCACGDRGKQCSGSAVTVVGGLARAEDVVGEHGDGAVDEAYVPVAAGVVGELLAG